MLRVNCRWFKLLDLNQTQVTQLKNAVEDGKITNDELNNITGLTEEQKFGILEFANKSNYFSTEETLSVLKILMQKQQWKTERKHSVNIHLGLCRKEER